MNLAETVFGDPDSDWHKTRAEAETKVLLAAAELLAHAGAATISLQGFGVSVKLECLPNAQ